MTEEIWTCSRLPGIDGYDVNLQMNHSEPYWQSHLPSVLTALQNQERFVN